MSVALIGSGVSALSTDGGNSVTTGAYDTTGANFIGVILSHDINSTDYTVTDNKSNTALLAIDAIPFSASSAIWYFQNPTVGAGHTFTVTKGAGSAPFPAIVVFAFSGMATVSVLDGTQVNSGGAGSGTSQRPGSVTPSANGYLVLSGLSGTAGTSSVAIDSSFSTPLAQLFSGGNAYAVAGSYLIQGTAGAVNPQFSWAGSSAHTATIAVFKAASGASFNPAWATGATKVIGGVF